MLPGDVQAWHFDEAQFVTTIMVKAPEGGGEFEYVPNLRSGAVEPYAEVNAVLSRTHPGIKKLPFTPGDMSIFCGGRSVHGVNAVHGPRSRYVAVLSYKDRPGFVNSAEVQQLFYGRTKQLSHADQQ